MAEDIKALRGRIKSVESTLQLTKAMGLVASSKIRRATLAMQKGRQFHDSCKRTVDMLSAFPECRQSVYMKERNEGKVCLIVLAGDRGLAGGFNANVFRMLKGYADATVIPIGKRIYDRYEGGYASSEKFPSEDGFELAKKLCSDFADGKYSKVGILYTEYISVMSQFPKVEWILPLTEKKDGDRKAPSGAVFEPGEREVLDFAVPLYVYGSVMRAVRESFAAEVAARRVAMDSAGKSAEEMTENLRLRYNRARQSAITQEITEIVAGSD